MNENLAKRTETNFTALVAVPSFAIAQFFVISVCFSDAAEIFALCVPLATVVCGMRVCVRESVVAHEPARPTTSTLGELPSAGAVTAAATVSSTSATKMSKAGTRS